MATSVRSESLEALPRTLVTPTRKQILGNTCLITKTIVYECVGVRNCDYLRFTEVFAFYDSAFTTLQSTRVARVSRSVLHLPSKMLLRFYRGEDGTRVYTLKKIDPNTGNQTLSAHPARFTPTDQHSKERIRIKERFGLLPTQKPAPVY